MCTLKIHKHRVECQTRLAISHRGAATRTAISNTTLTTNTRNTKKIRSISPSRAFAFFFFRLMRNKYDPASPWIRQSPWARTQSITNSGSDNSKKYSQLLPLNLLRSLISVRCRQKRICLVLCFVGPGLGGLVAFGRNADIETMALAEEIGGAGASFCLTSQRTNGKVPHSSQRRSDCAGVIFENQPLALGH